MWEYRTLYFGQSTRPVDWVADSLNDGWVVVSKHTVGRTTMILFKRWCEREGEFQIGSEEAR